ncbi:MAG: hypothetical protein M3O61_04590 [Gemmatimonadota bacterium]|nr:hypothetical protein [Gemmatimonadota bacterium]
MGCIDRAMCVYDAVIRAIEERGDVVEVQNKRDGYAQPQYRTVVLNDSEFIEMEVTEAKKRIELQADRSGYLSSKYGFVPSGRLAIGIRNGFPGGRSRWADDAKHTLESQLGKFIHALAVAAVDLKAQRRRREELERERLDAQRRELEESERRWLADNFHRHGMRYRAEEMIAR